MLGGRAEPPPGGSAMQGGQAAIDGSAPSIELGPRFNNRGSKSAYAFETKAAGPLSRQDAGGLARSCEVDNLAIELGPAQHEHVCHQAHTCIEQGMPCTYGAQLSRRAHGLMAVSPAHACVHTCGVHSRAAERLSSRTHAHVHVRTSRRSRGAELPPCFSRTHAPPTPSGGVRRKGGSTGPVGPEQCSRARTRARARLPALGADHILLAPHRGAQGFMHPRKSFAGYRAGATGLPAMSTCLRSTFGHARHGALTERICTSDAWSHHTSTQVDAHSLPMRPLHTPCARGTFGPRLHVLSTRGVTFFQFWSSEYVRSQPRSLTH